MKSPFGLAPATLSRIAAALVVAIGLSVLLGWLLDIPVLKSPVSGLIAMKANTALAFIAAGMACWWTVGSPRQRRWAAWAAVFAGVAGSLTVVEYVADVDLGIDQLLFREASLSPGTSDPGRMAPSTALNFILFAAAILLLDHRTRGGYYLSTFLILFAGLIASLSLTGYVYGATILYGVGPYTHMAVHATIAFLLLTAAVLLARPERTPMTILLADTSGGLMVRRLLPTLCLVLFVLGWLELHAEKARLVDTALGNALLVLSGAGVSVGLVAWNASALHRADVGRQQAEAELQMANARLEQRVAERTAAAEERTRELAAVNARLQEEIRERQRAEAVLRRSEERYRSLTVATAQIIWTTNERGEVTEDMPSWRAYTGYTWEQIKGAGWVNSLHPDDRERTLAIWEQATATGSLYETEYRIRHRDGEYRYVTVRGAPVRDGAGNIREWVGTCTDITDRKQAEESLRRSEERYALAVEGSNDGLWDWNVRTGEVYFAPRWKSMIGYEDHELANRYDEWESRLHPEDRARVLNSLQDYLGGEVPNYEVEFRLRHKDGSWRWILARCATVRDAAGKPYRLAGSQSDITARKQLEAELRAASAYNRSLIEASLDPLVMIGREGKITDVNAAAEATTGRGRAELIGTDFADYFTEPEKARASYQQVFREGFVRDYALEIRGHDGHTRSVLYNAAVFRDEAGQVIGVVAAARDITERKKAEEALKRERQRFKDVLDSMPIKVCLLTPDYHVTFANRAFKEYFGEDRGRHCYEYLFGQSAPCEFCETYQVLKTGKPHRWRCLLPDGRGVIDTFDVPFTDTDGSPLILEAEIDITEQEETRQALEHSLEKLSAAEKELRLNHERLVLAMKAGEAASFDWDIANNINIWSPEIEALYGLQAGEFGGNYDSWEALVIPEDREAARAAIQQSLKTGEFALEFRIRYPGDGALRWIAARAKVLFDEAGRPTRMLGINWDITERKRMQAAVEESELAFRTMAEAMPQLVWMCTPDGLNVYFNQQWVDYTGLTLAESFGTGWNKPFHPDDQQLACDAWKRAVESSGAVPYRLECRLRKADGSYHWHLVKGVPLRDTAGQVVKWFGTCTDIDDLKRAEEALRQANAYNRSLIEVSLDPLVTIGPDGKITDVNAATEAATGRGRTELFGTDFADYFTEPDQARASYQQVFREGSVRDYALEIRHRDSHTTPVLYNASIYRDEAGQVVGVFAAARDISERRKAERLVAEQTARLREQAELLDLAHDAIMVRGLGGPISFWNHGAEEMYGWTRDEALGKRSHELLRTRFPRPLPELEAELLRDGRWEGILVHTRKDGTVLEVASRWALKEAKEGQAPSALEINNDITAQRRAEAELARRAEELARSNRELEQFAYIASHDLQEPLRMVSSYVELLAQRYRGQLDDRADKYIHYAVDGATRMQSLIQDLLTYSRVTTRGKPLVATNSSVVLDQALANLQKAIEETGAIITRDPLPTVLADATQLMQVLQNLIANSLKFCEQKPPHVHIAAELRGEEWQFAVRDNGIGIAPEHVERVFQVFQRLHPRGRYPGTGIGLAVCKKVVERHGGRIWVESQPGQGSTFYFTVPAIPTEATNDDHSSRNGQAD